MMVIGDWTLRRIDIVFAKFSRLCSTINLEILEVLHFCTEMEFQNDWKFE